MPNHTTAEMAQVLIKAYREQLYRLYGPAHAEAAHLTYEHRRFIVRRGLSVRHVRLARFEQMIDTLRAHQPAEDVPHV